jgi:tetratricopeptide (TPR) repeat protein
VKLALLISRVAPAVALLLAAGCAELKPAADKPQAVSPQITEAVLRDRAHEQLALGIKQYESGDYDNAVKSLSASLDHGLLTKAEQATARKHLAFVHCVSNREAQCRDEFRKAFEIYSDFSLNSAEDGHPIWGPVYRNVRTQLIAEREAAARKPMSLLPLGKAEQLLADGTVKYDSGEYEAAHKLFDAAMKEGLKEKADQVRAMKQSAFSLCLQNKITLCRAEFVRIYDLDPDFDLTPAEAGHPSWTKTFAQAKVLGKKHVAEKAAKEKSAREKAALPVAPVAVPKKN